MFEHEIPLLGPYYMCTLLGFRFDRWKQLQIILKTHTLSDIHLLTSNNIQGQVNMSPPSTPDFKQVDQSLAQ